MRVDIEHKGGVALPDKLRAVARELRPKFRIALKKSAETVKADAASRTSGWSRRIPRSLAVRVSFARKNPRVYILARKRIAIHARLYEGIEGEKSFRHPYYWRQAPWYTQATRPYLVPALHQNRAAAVAAAHKAFDDTARRLGFTIS